MVREPTEAELNIINVKIAKKKMSASDCYIMDAKPANDHALTCYFYRLGTSSLKNFINDFPVPALVSHVPGLPIGTWITGVLVELREGKHEIQSAVYMAKNLSIEGHNTDELVKSYEAGHLTDVSVGWREGKPICDICHRDIRDPDCPHYPGRIVDAKTGQIATCTIEDAHLNEISFVWKGGLPGAKLGDIVDDKLYYKKQYEDFHTTADGWDTIKHLPLTASLSSHLIMPINGINIDGGDEEMTFDEALKIFEKDIYEIFVPKAEHDALSQKFADINAEIENNKDFLVIGKARIDELTNEYHRVGIALYGDKWNAEAETDMLNAMDVIAREKLMLSRIETMKTDLYKFLKKEEIEDNKSQKQELTGHKARNKYYKIGK